MEHKKLKIKISKKGYTEKPTIHDMSIISNSFKAPETTKVVTYEELKKFLEKGHSVLLAEYKEEDSIKSEYIKSISCLALDIDSKENKINMNEMISKIYNMFDIMPVISYPTFSDNDFTKFRLIYDLEYKIDAPGYKILYKALAWKLKEVDKQAINPNRVWAGTNKSVMFHSDFKSFKHDKILKLVYSYQQKLLRDEKKTKKVVAVKGTTAFNNNDFIKKEFKKEVSELILQNVNLKDYIQCHFGGNFKRYNEHFIGACPIHGGDNKSALLISKRIYTCFTRCGTGNIFTLAEKVLKSSNFSYLALTLATEHNIKIDEKWVVRR